MLTIGFLAGLFVALVYSELKKDKMIILTDELIVDKSASKEKIKRVAAMKLQNEIVASKAMIIRDKGNNRYDVILKVIR